MEIKRGKPRLVFVIVCVLVFVIVGIVAIVNIAIPSKETTVVSSTKAPDVEDMSQDTQNSGQTTSQEEEDSSTDSTQSKEETVEDISSSTNINQSTTKKNNTTKANNKADSKTASKSKEIKNIKNILEAKKAEDDEPKEDVENSQQIKLNDVSMYVPKTYKLTARKGSKWKYTDASTKETMLVNIGNNKKSMYDEKQALRDYVFENYEVSDDDTYSFNGNDFEVYTCKTSSNKTSLVAIAANEKKKLIITYDAGQDKTNDFKDILSTIKF